MMSSKQRAPSSGNITRANTGIADDNYSPEIQGTGAISIWYWDNNSGENKGYGCIPYDPEITNLKVDASRQITSGHVKILLQKKGEWITYQSPNAAPRLCICAGFCGPQYGAGKPENWNNTLNFADQNGKRCYWDNDLNNWIAE